jgi:murein DD-endopeptidase MepM/ murein hydrolase activator NlpD
MKILDIITEAELEGKIVVVGDTIAQGIGSAIPNAVVVAGAGLDSASVASQVMANTNKLKGADLAIVSAGTYDVKPGNYSLYDPDATGANLRAIKTALKAKKIVWIRGYNAGVSKAVSKIASIDGDKQIDLKNYPTADKLIPSSYSDVAGAATYGMKAIDKPVSLDANPEVNQKIDGNEKKDGNKDTTNNTPGKVYPYDKDIEDLQKDLLALGYTLKFGADGRYGDDTRAALRDFQTTNKLPVTGLPDKATGNLIDQHAKDPAKYKRPTTAGASPEPGGGAKTPVTAGKVASPVKGAISVTSPMGMRNGHFHQGVDIKAGTPTPLYSPINGTVTKAGDGWAGTGGSGVKIEGGGQTHKFFHMSSISVKEGQPIKQGDQFGISGGVKGAPGSGNATGPHIHWEMWTNDKPVDPMQYIGQ